MNNSVFSKNPSVLSRASDVDVQFVHLDVSHEVLKIVGLARFVWLEIDGRRPVRSIIDHIAAQQDLAPKLRKRFEADVLRFIKEMEDLKMIDLCRPE